MNKKDQELLKDFYFTFASDQQHGPGYTKISAKNSCEAREIMFKRYNDKWSFRYKSLDKIHPNDKKREIVWEEDS